MVRKNLAGRVYDEYSPGALSEQIALVFRAICEFAECGVNRTSKTALFDFSRRIELREYKRLHTPGFKHILQAESSKNLLVGNRT